MARIDLGNVIGPQGPKGDKGDTGAAGTDGKDYVLTEADKTEIAGQVAPVPVNNTTTNETFGLNGITVSTTDLTAGSSALETGKLYFVYE